MKPASLLFFALAHYFMFQDSAQCQTASSGQLAEIDHIALHVRDLQKSTEFYRADIGLEAVADPFKDGRHAFFRLSEHTQLHLIAGAQGDTQHDMNVHFALRVKSVEAYRKLFEQRHINYFNAKKEKGAVTTRPDGVHQIYFQDPDGYWVEVNDNRL